MLSPLLLQQDPFFFDMLMGDPKTLATLSDELCHSVSDVSTTSTPTSTTILCGLLDHTMVADGRDGASEAPPLRPNLDLPLKGFETRPELERPASTNSGRDFESAESEASTTPTPGWDELLNPRVLGRAESAAYRRQRAKLREHRRLVQQREAFEKLQGALPGNTSRMSRLDLLRLAIRHIQELHRSLSEEQDSPSTANSGSDVTHPLI